jgi:hypothetical protein
MEPHWALASMTLTKRRIVPSSLILVFVIFTDYLTRTRHPSFLTFATDDGKLGSSADSIRRSQPSDIQESSIPGRHEPIRANPCSDQKNTAPGFSGSAQWLHIPSVDLERYRSEALGTRPADRDPLSAYFYGFALHHLLRD